MAEHTINVNRHREIIRWKLARSRKLSGDQKVIIGIIADYMHSERRVAFPDFDLLAEKTGYNRSTVIRAINAGREAKILHRLHKGGIIAGKSRANEYTFPLTREEIVAHRPPISQNLSGAGATLIVAHPPPLLVAQAPPHTLSDTLIYTKKERNMDMEVKESGECSEPFPWIDIAFPSPDRDPFVVRKTPLPPGSAAPPSPKRLDMAALHAEMASRGMDLGESRRRR